MKQLVIAGLCLALAGTHADAQINAGEQQPEASLPFNMVQVTTLNLPWRIAFLPDGRMLITEKVFGFLLAALAVQLALDGLHDVGVVHLTGH